MRLIFHHVKSGDLNFRLGLSHKVSSRLYYGRDVEVYV